MDPTDAVVPTPLDRDETLARLGTHPAPARLFLIRKRSVSPGNSRAHGETMKLAFLYRTK